MDAEDIVQDAMIKFRTAAPENIDNVKAYLAKITTRLSINYMKTARKTRESYIGPWLPEPLLGTENSAELDAERNEARLESISIAFMTLLEKLTPGERAVFLLREVFEYDYPAIASILEKNEASCRKLLSRAKEQLASNVPRFEADSDQHLNLLEKFIEATTKGDLKGLEGLLTEDVVLWADAGGLVQGAATRPLAGNKPVARFLMNISARLTPLNAKITLEEVNGKPGLMLCDDSGKRLFVLSIESAGNRISRLWAMGNPEKLVKLSGTDL